MVREQNFRTRRTSGDGLQGRSLLVAPKVVSPVKALGYTPLHRKQVLWDTAPTCHQCVSTSQHINTLFNASLTAHFPWSRDDSRQRARPLTVTVVTRLYHERPFDVLTGGLALSFFERVTYLLCAFGFHHLLCFSRNLTFPRRFRTAQLSLGSARVGLLVLLKCPPVPRAALTDIVPGYFF